MDHKHEVIDNDDYLVINPETRIIRCTKKTTVAWMDHNSEYISFKVPRFIEKHDMSLCNNIEIHYRNYGDNGSKSGVYIVSGLQADAKDKNMLTFDWLISNDVTSIVGSVIFTVGFQCLKNNRIVYSWNTKNCEANIVADCLPTYTMKDVVRDDTYRVTI